MSDGMEPLVSILIPAYNAEEWTGDAVRSALAQTWKKKEIILVDDGSTDKTLAIARQFASSSVKVVTQPNQGAAAARNKAFSISQGDFIQWLDADDLLDPDKISRQLAALGDQPGERILLSSAWGYFIHRTNKARFLPTSLWCDLAPVEWMLRCFERGHWMQTATWLVSRELTKAAGPWDTRLLGDDDGEYFSRIILASDGIRFTPDARVFYRRSPNSLSYVGRSRRKLEAQFLSMRLQFNHLRALEDSARVRSACLHYLQTFFVYFYPDWPDIVRQAQQLAADLGGSLAIPQLSWKYAWIQKLFGWRTAKLTQLYYNKLKSSLIRRWDKALYQLERSRIVTDSAGRDLNQRPS
jgi:glycosyltransferase involved in cell wall biosynthesis